MAENAVQYTLREDKKSVCKIFFSLWCGCFHDDLIATCGHVLAYKYYCIAFARASKASAQQMNAATVLPDCGFEKPPNFGGKSFFIFQKESHFFKK